MQRLPLRPKYRARVLDGSKYATIRLGRRRVEPGDRVPLTFGRRYSPIVVVVQRVTYTRVGELTSADALADGFTCRDELLDAIGEHYPNAGADAGVTIIRFKIDWEATNAR